MWLMMLVYLKITDVSTLILMWIHAKLYHKMVSMLQYNLVYKQMTNIVNLIIQIKDAFNLNN